MYDLFCHESLIVQWLEHLTGAQKVMHVHVGTKFVSGTCPTLVISFPRDIFFIVGGCSFSTNKFALFLPLLGTSLTRLFLPALITMYKLL